MKELLSRIKTTASILYAKGLISHLSVVFNPFSPKRKRPEISRFIRYTREVLKGDDLEIGEFTYGTPTIFKEPGTKLKIGKFCSIATGLAIELRGDHRHNFVSTYPFRAFVDDWPEAIHLRPEDVDAVSKGEVIIGNDVWIGIGATILSGVKIGDGAVIGACSVVAKDVEPYSIVAGNPARLIRKRFDERTISKLLEIRWWDWPIEKIRENLHIISSDKIEELYRVSQT